VHERSSYDLPDAEPSFSPGLGPEGLSTIPGNPCSSRVILTASHPNFRDFLAARGPKHHARIDWSGRVKFAARKMVQFKDRPWPKKGGDAEQRLQNANTITDLTSCRPSIPRNRIQRSKLRPKLAKSRTRPTLLVAVTGKTMMGWRPVPVPGTNRNRESAGREGRSPCTSWSGLCL